MLNPLLKTDLEHLIKEDGVAEHLYYLNKLPSDLVLCQLKLKSSLLLSGLPFFSAVFDYLGSPLPDSTLKLFEETEGKFFNVDGERVLAEFELPFGVALTGERLALNLLAHCSKISTLTHQFVERAQALSIAILDTRKTTPGLRALEKYAVRQGGGFNHRYSQTDLWMIKDNHKSFFGGLAKAVEFFRSMQGFYTPILAEIHSLEELEEAVRLEIPHVMLDNFSPELIKQAIDRKPDGMSYEISGGVTLQNLESYLIRGIDAISIGRLTYGAEPVDISLKMKKISLC